MKIFNTTYLVKFENLAECGAFMHRIMQSIKGLHSRLPKN